MRVLVRGQRLSVAVESRQPVHDGELFVQAGKCQIEGKFPNWRNVLPDFANLQLGSSSHPDGVAMNAHYLARCAQVQPARGSGHYGGVQLWHCPEKPAMTLVQFLEVPEMVALIMGMRVGGLDKLLLLPKFEPVPTPQVAANDADGAVKPEAVPQAA